MSAYGIVTRYSCQDCGKDLPRGTGVLRSRNLSRVVAWCDRCYGIKYLGHPEPAPMVGGTLSQRLARALSMKGGKTGSLRKLSTQRG